MSLFEFVTVAISIILGLGVTELLSSSLELVRARRVVRLHWIPLLWAASILWIQLTFWWQLFGVSEAAGVWSHVNFIVTALTAMSLFAAGSLILPKHYSEGGLDLLEHFQMDGKAGVLAFLLFHIMAVPFNARIFAAAVFSRTSLLIAVMVALLIGLLRSKTPRWEGTFTLLFVAVQLAVLVQVVVPEFAP